MAATLTVEQEQVSDYPIASLRIHRVRTLFRDGSRRHLEAIDSLFFLVLDVPAPRTRVRPRNINIARSL